MRPLGEVLAAHGFAVRGIRLPGHGTTVADLAERHWTEWFAAVEQEQAALAATTTHTAVVGLSMGALLALHLAATRPTTVTALVLCSTALALRDPRVRLLPLLARIPAVARRYRLLPKRGRRDIADPAARARSFTYAATPLAGVLELLRLQRRVRGELGRVHQPTLLLHGRDDHTVPVATLARLRRRLGSGWIEAHILERSWHVITLDVEHDRVADLTADFLDRVEQRAVGGGSPG